jgi:uncharacterized membrane protein YgcG
MQHIHCTSKPCKPCALQAMCAALHTHTTQTPPAHTTHTAHTEHTDTAHTDNRSNALLLLSIILIISHRTVFCDLECVFCDLAFKNPCGNNQNPLSAFMLHCRTPLLIAAHRCSTFVGGGHPGGGPAGGGGCCSGGGAAATTCDPTPLAVAKYESNRVISSAACFSQIHPNTLRPLTGGC